MIEATIFNIERYATEDGRGIRTIVFLKGCLLRCIWCANPESQEFTPQILFNANACIGCGKCITKCSNNAISLLSPYGYITDTQKCILCGRCVDNCYQNARTVSGQKYKVKELVDIVLKDKKYYEKSGGGVTFSGGEPLMYPEFIAKTADRLHKENINVLVETCGYVDFENIKKAYEKIDTIFFDIKIMDEQKHIEYTTKSNKLILDNLNWLVNNYKGEIVVRYPYIPGYNDGKEDIKQFLDYIESLKKIKEIWFLPYHRLGLPKYQGLGRKYEMGEKKSLKMKDITYLKEYEKEYNFTIRV